MTDAKSRWPSLAETVGREVLAPHAGEVDRQGCWPVASVSALGESGLLGLTVPAPFGGAEEGPRTFAAVTRTLAEHCASTAMIYLMHVCATQTVVAAGEFSPREDLLRSVAKGRHLNTVAFSEKGSRSHFWAPVSQARAEGGAQRLSAEKSFVTSAGHADGYVVSTRSAGATDPLVSTLYYVPRGAPGLSVSGAWKGLGLRGNASAPVRLEGVELPATHRLGSEGGGFALMMSAVLPWFQLGTAAVAVGIAAAATRGTREHLLSAKLEHLGQPLASLPNLRARLAQMRIAVDTQEAFLEHVAGRMENPGPETLLALLESKAAAAEAAVQVTDLAMRTCGGAAFGCQLTVERNFRDARAGAVMAPTTDVLYDFVARTVLDMPLF
jgi:alkylation response protein AidB-like acyl-CoA dehydrogenase